MDNSLTTTSYAVLSQLALKPWSAYELAEQKTRYFQYMWPRASSGIYTEIKRLATIGLARAEKGHVGKRPRTVYSITDAGLDALREWLATPLSPMALEFEALTRVFMAPWGTKETLLMALDEAWVDADNMLRLAADIRQEYLERRAPFQETVYVRVFVVEFLTLHARLTRDWVERTRAEVATWHDLSPDGKTKHALQILTDLGPYETGSGPR